MFQRCKMPMMLLASGIGITVAIASCSPDSPSQASISTNSDPSAEITQTPRDSWQKMTPEETQREWENILDNPLGIAALNQLAIEGFIRPDCTKTFYVNEPYQGFQTLLRVQCGSERGVSSAIAYDEMRVIFSRFEGSIEDFEVRRISQETPPEINLPD